MQDNKYKTCFLKIHSWQLTSKQTAEYSSNQKDADELSQPPWSSNAYAITRWKEPEGCQPGECPNGREWQRVQWKLPPRHLAAGDNKQFPPRSNKSKRKSQIRKVTGFLWPTPKGRIRDQAIENLRDSLLGDLLRAQHLYEVTPMADINWTSVAYWW